MTTSRGRLCLRIRAERIRIVVVCGLDELRSLPSCFSRATESRGRSVSARASIGRALVLAAARLRRRRPRTGKRGRHVKIRGPVESTSLGRLIDFAYRDMRSRLHK
jgi:hypothetical protein